MQAEVPSQSFVWGVLSERFQSALTIQLSEIWRLSGLLEEYGTIALEFTRKREEKAIIEELTGLLVQAVAKEAIGRRSANSSGRSVGRPRDVITPYLAPELLTVYLRCHNSGGRQSVATSIDGKLQQKEAGELFGFIKEVIEPLNQYLTRDLHRGPLSASRLARFALDDRRRTAREIERDAARALAKKRRSP
jgi:hypothetical protein